MEFDPPRVSVRDQGGEVNVSALKANVTAHALADKPSHMIDRTCVELLLIESAHTLQASTAYKAKQANDMIANLEVQDPGAHVPPRLSASDQTDMAAGRMESLGRHVGANLVEQYVDSNLLARLMRHKPRLTDTLERVKFVCKELWSAVWDKQIDNLRTNHKGVFVLQDQALKTLTALSQRDQASVYVAMQLAYASGLLHGALERLGVACSVQVDAEYLPVCTFHVRLSTA